MGPAQLFNLFTGIQLISRSHPSRAHVLVQGNARQCTGRRAEAIMSVLGVTDWFSDTTSHGALVLGMYPLAFVNEVRQKIGPEFFLARKFIGAPRSSRDYFPGSARGSLLPFEELDSDRLCGKRDVKMAVYQAYSSQFHPSVPSWSLENTGSFTIRHAAVLASSDNDYPAIVPVEVLLSYQSSPGEDIHKDRIDIMQWLEEQPKQYLTFAVNISRDLGLILQGFHTPKSRPLKLIKIGCYEVFGRLEQAESPKLDDWLSSQPVDWVPTKEVDWVVL